MATLAGVRVEDRVVLDESHAEVARWFREGLVDGAADDHPGRRAGPRGYLGVFGEVTDGAWTVVEKILEPGEHLPSDWRTGGRQGYDSLAAVLTGCWGPGPRGQLRLRLAGRRSCAVAHPRAGTS
ncbi:hypothetical protein QJS66_20685 [Kocuria rhizophila]|nr:hypothetical protein QJS66_20685 [Kocuria rhizophila]